VNLHAVVAPYVGAVNPLILVTWEQSNGYTQAADLSRTPTYHTVNGVQAQRQALTYKDLMQLSGLNINGEACALYINGDAVGVLRPDAKGGDLFRMPDGSEWLVVHVLENWNATAGWTKVACTRQRNPS
jgi:hypothetical protein